MTNDIDTEYSAIEHRVSGGHISKDSNIWDERAALHGDRSGTNDFILQGLEERLMDERFTPCRSLLDLGCGDGALLRILKDRVETAVGMDSSEKMLDLSRKRNLGSSVEFIHGDLTDISSTVSGTFDAITTKRALINLKSFDEQFPAIKTIASLLNAGGIFYMIENTVEGLDRLNTLRSGHGLEPMEAPWHNRYFTEPEIEQIAALPELDLVETVEFASTYYLLSRVVYAKVAQEAGEELRYDSPINMVSKDLPSYGDVGATRMFVFRKN